MNIIPAILPHSYDELEDKINLVKSLVPLVQVDICDGHYTSEPSWPYRKHDDHFEAMQREEEGMPYWQEVDVEIDLMAERPEELVDEWILAGASRIIIHVDAVDKLDPVLEALRGRVEVGLALNLDTPIDTIAPYIDQIALVQCMGIAHIGFQGEPFDERTIAKVHELRAKYPNLAIGVDGGVSLDNAQLLIEAGATRLVVGSAIYTAENIPDTIHALRRLV